MAFYYCNPEYTGKYLLMKHLMLPALATLVIACCVTHLYRSAVNRVFRETTKDRADPKLYWPSVRRNSNYIIVQTPGKNDSICRHELPGLCNE